MSALRLPPTPRLPRMNLPCLAWVSSAHGFCWAEALCALIPATACLAHISFSWDNRTSPKLKHLSMLRQSHVLRQTQQQNGAHASPGPNIATGVFRHQITPSKHEVRVLPDWEPFVLTAAAGVTYLPQNKIIERSRTPLEC